MLSSLSFSIYSLDFVDIHISLIFAAAGGGAAAVGDDAPAAAGAVGRADGAVAAAYLIQWKLIHLNWNNVVCDFGKC